MKKMFLSLALSLFAFAASAGALTQNFVADNGRVFQIANVLSVDYNGWSVVIKTANGGNQYFDDATGAVYARIISSAGFNSRFVRVGTSNRYMNTQTNISEISCISNQTVFAWAIGANQPEYFNDGCALHTAVRNASN